MNSDSRIFCSRCGRERHTDAGVCPSCGYDASAAITSGEPLGGCEDTPRPDPPAADEPAHPDSGRRRSGALNQPDTSAQVASFTVCPRCRSDNPPGGWFCGNCGVALLRACLRCGALNPEGTRYCHQCGAPSRDVSARVRTTGSRNRIRHLDFGWTFRWGRALRLESVSDALDSKLKSVRVAFLSARQSLDVWEDDVEFPGSGRAGRFTEAVLVSILTLIGFLIRVWNVGSVPAGPAGDESAVALEVIRILNGEWIGIWSGAALGNPTGQMYWIAPFFWLGGSTLEMLRLSSVLLGTALIPICYLMVRMLFPFRVAFIAAALLTFFTWFVVVYRIASP